MVVSAFLSVAGSFHQAGAMDTQPLAGYVKQGLIRVVTGHPDRLRIVIKSGTIRVESLAMPSLPFSPAPQSVSAV
jgi:hypothetical protein